MGYIVTSCLLNENHDFLRLAINTVRNDIIGRNETFQCLALTMVWEHEISFTSQIYLLIYLFSNYVKFCWRRNSFSFYTIKMLAYGLLCNVVHLSCTFVSIIYVFK